MRRRCSAWCDATVARFGRLDVLVNNAAVRNEQPFDAIAFDDWRRIVSIVLDGAFLCSQAALPHLRRAGGGSIVNIGGETGHKGAAARAHVVTAKAGLAGFTKALALDLAADAITVNCVVPGRIATRAEGKAAPGHHRDLPPVGRTGSAGGSRGAGAHAVRAGRALHHRAVAARERRQLTWR